MTDGFTPVEETPTTICKACKHQVKQKVAKCPKCNSTNVHTSTMRHFPGGRMARGGHILDVVEFSGGDDPPVSTG